MGWRTRLTGPFLSLLTVALASPALAQAPQASPPAAGAILTVQQAFDAGTQAIEKQDWAKALTIYEGLEQRLQPNKRAERSLAIVRIRKAQALYALRRFDDAEAHLQESLGKLPTDDASLVEDRAIALTILGSLAERRFDYPQAVDRFREAARIDGPLDLRLRGYTKLLRLASFVDRTAGLADADTALALAKPKQAELKTWVAIIQNLRGRILLNMDRKGEATAALDEAVKLLGGSTFGKIDAFDFSARSDAAIAAILNDKPDDARAYLAKTGAAMMASQGFRLGADMNPPQCGSAVTGPKPEDVAIVEFSIREDGGVAGSVPIYFSGAPENAAEFARAVSEWSWSADDLKKVSPFLRAQTRLEMRCTTVFGRPDTLTLIAPDLDRWLTGRSDPLPQMGASQVRRVLELRAELARRETAHGKESVQVLAPLVELAAVRLVPQDEAWTLIDRATAIAKQNDAPAAVRTVIAMVATKNHEGADHSSLLRALERLFQLRTDPVIAKDPRAMAAITLFLADANRLGKTETASLQSIANDTRLAANEPFRIGALTRLASLESKAGRIDSARELFNQTGLTAQQCALSDAVPRKKSGNIRDESYPDEALQWGFGGWVTTEFDIDAEGRPQNTRPLIAFPPFVFGKPTAKAVEGFRFERRYRPEGTLGCGGNRQNVTYNFGG